MGHNTPMGSPLLCQVDNVARSRRPITGVEGIEMLTAAATPRQPPSSTSTTFIPDVGNTDPKRPQESTNATQNPSRGVTPDSQVGKTIMKLNQSNLSSFPSNPQGLAPGVRSRVESTFHQDDASASAAGMPRSILSQPLPPFQTPFISPFHGLSRPAVPSPPPPFTTFGMQPSTPSSRPPQSRTTFNTLRSPHSTPYQEPPPGGGHVGCGVTMTRMMGRLTHPKQFRMAQTFQVCSHQQKAFA